MAIQQHNSAEKVIGLSRIKKSLINTLISELGFALWIRSYLFVSPNQSLDEYDFCDGQNKTCGFDVHTLMEAVNKICLQF